jgi:hypothetical protein
MKICRLLELFHAYRWMYGGVLIDTAGFELHQETVQWYLHIPSTTMVILHTVRHVE